MHTRARGHWLLLLALSPLIALAAGALAAGCDRGSNGGSSSNANEILIGHYASMTGATATFGVSADEGIKLAEKEVNAAGGVLGKKVRVLTEDDRSQLEEAATA